MKQLYLLLAGSGKSLLLLLTLTVAYAAQGQIYYAALSGASEAPPNASPATGKTTVTINNATSEMRVQVSFSGLLAPNTASHIHAPTAVPGVGTAGVATTVPTFTGFPTGNTSGTYDHTFNMLLASSYNPVFLNNATNGGNPATAFNTLKTALNNGTSYLNIHTSVFPGGEIRGFLQPCPTIHVTFPDAFALPSGVLPNTVYPAYAPASSLTLTTSVSGGTGPYSYNWSNSATTSSITVSPTVTTPYTVTVTDQFGCRGTATKTVNVIDVSSGKNGNKIEVCHKGRNSLSIGYSAVADHLAHGDMLGSCAEAQARQRPVTEQAIDGAVVKVMRNPSSTGFELQITGNADHLLQIKIYDLMGRVVETRPAVQSNQTLRFGAGYQPGTYIVEIIRGSERQTIKLVKGF